MSAPNAQVAPDSGSLWHRVQRATEGFRELSVCKGSVRQKETGKVADSSPVDKHSAACIESILDELVGGLEMLKEIFVINIINFYNFVREASELFLIGLEFQDGEHMGNSGLLQRFFAAQREQTTK